jgi:hypothetical protein
MDPGIVTHMHTEAHYVVFTMYAKCLELNLIPTAIVCTDVMHFCMTGSDNNPRPVQSIGEPAPKLLQDAFSSSKFQELMKATSKHTDLLQANEELAQDQYFEKLEKKEQLELKMMDTYKVPCKAVQCAKVRISIPVL